MPWHACGAARGTGPRRQWTLPAARRGRVIAAVVSLADSPARCDGKVAVATHTTLSSTASYDARPLAPRGQSSAAVGPCARGRVGGSFASLRHWLLVTRRRRARPRPPPLPLEAIAAAAEPQTSHTQLQRVQRSSLSSIALAGAHVAAWRPHSGVVRAPCDAAVPAWMPNATWTGAVA